MTALLALVPWWGRALAIVGAMAAAAAFGAVKMHAHDMDALDDAREALAAFKGEAAGLGIAAQQRADARRLHDVNAAKESQSAAENDLENIKPQFIAALQRLRDGSPGNSGSSVVPTTTGGAGIPAGAICFDRAGLDTGISGLLRKSEERLGVDFQEYAGQVILLNRAREWARAIGPKPAK